MTTGTGLDLAPVDGARSSQRFGKQVLADAVATVDPALAGRITGEQKWRKNYISYFRDVVEAGARSAKNARLIASSGLASLHDNLEVSGSDAPVREWLRGGVSLETTTITGTGPRSRALALPFGGDVLTGDELNRRLDAWVEQGIIEQSCADAVRSVQSHPEWLDLSDVTIALLGAASEMGPLEALSGWGAEIVAVDLPRPHLWDKIVSIARAGSGRLHIPSRRPVAAGEAPTGSAGTDLLTDLPAIRAWLNGFDTRLVVGNHVYADGSSFVRVAGAADALVADLVENDRVAAHAYLATPTDVFAVPEEVAAAARARRGGIGSRVTRTLSAGTLRVPNYGSLVEGEGRRWGIADVLVPVQGANYALAKAIQRWRAVVTREEDRVVSSANVAPATKTASVVKNKMLAAAYRGAPRFGVEIFAPETSRVLMAALLVHDLRNPQAAASPASDLGHPFDLFAQGAAHGGLWRLPYEARSVLPLALGLGLVKRK